MQMTWKELDDRIYLAADFEKEPAEEIIGGDANCVSIRDGKRFVLVMGKWKTKKNTSVKIVDFIASIEACTAMCKLL